MQNPKVEDQDLKTLARWFLELLNYVFYGYGFALLCISLFIFVFTRQPQEVSSYLTDKVYEMLMIGLLLQLTTIIYRRGLK